jgi:transposase
MAGKQNKRKRFQASFKAKVALAALRGDRTTSELTAAFGVHASQISQWKKQLQDGAIDVFADGRKRADVDHRQLESDLYQQIGRLQVELGWLKKKAGGLD